MTQTSKLDITSLEERGLTLGLNEFPGYVGVAMAGIATAYMASQFGPADWISWYNHRRPHQELKMKTPAEAYALAA